MAKLAAFLTHCLPLNREFIEAARYPVLVGLDDDDSNVAVLHKVCTAFCFQENFQRGLLMHSDRQTNQFSVQQNIVMIFCHSLRDTKQVSYLRDSQTRIVLEQQFQKSDGVRTQLALWARASKLLIKVWYLLLKVRILRFQRRNLLRKQSDLLLKKIDYVFAQTGGGRDSGDFLRRIDRTHTNSASKQTAVEISNALSQKSPQI